MKRKELSSVLAVLLIIAVFAAGIYGLSSYTAPIIQKNRAAADFAPLLAVMPEAEGFELLYSAEMPENQSLGAVPETVRGIYRESSGLGYVLKLSSSQGYTGEPIELSMAVDAEGRISGIEINAYPETKELGSGYTESYLGQDSSLGDVSMVSGATFSCTAFKNAVADGFSVLTENGLVSAGVKSDEQLLMEIAANVFSGAANYSGILQYEELEAGENMLKLFRSLNGGSLLAILPLEEGSCLAAVNLTGSLKAIDAEGRDITESLPPELSDSLRERAKQELSSFSERDLKRLSRMLPESAQFTELPLDGIFSSVSTAFRVKDGGNEYLAFAARSYGYSNEIMPIYCILDENGASVSLSCPELILHKEYFDDYTLDESAYREGFAGLDRESFTGEQSFISGATMSSQAVSTAVEDIFEAFSLITEEGGGENE